MTDAHAILERCLDEYDRAWQGSQLPPSLMHFYEQNKAALAIEDTSMFAHELALIDMEHRWRRFFNSQPQAEIRHRGSDPIPLLPEWSDYFRLMNFGSLPIAGVCHEFRVRQLFGDRPGYGLFCSRYAEHAAALALELTDCAAELSRAQITVSRDHRLVLTASLPGRLEIGRARTDEPAAPCCTKTDDIYRLVIAEPGVRHLSRNQLRIEVIALNRITVRNEAPAQGRLLIEPSLELKFDAMELDLPCRLRFSQWTFCISAEA